MIPFRKAIALCAFGALAVWASCAHRAGSFNPTSFHQDRYGYDVRYQDPATLQVLGSDWRLDNYNAVGNMLRPKTDGPYVTTFEFDTDGDGVMNTTETLPTYDLRFENMRTASVIWLRCLPYPPAEAAKDLRTLLLEYVEASVGAGYEAARIGKMGPVAGQRFALQVINVQPARLAGQEAMAALLDVASLDPAQQQMPGARKRVKLVLVRPSFVHDLSYWKVQFPVLIVAGFAAQPELFDQNVMDLQTLLNQVVLAGYMGYAEQAPAAAIPIAPPDASVPIVETPSAPAIATAVPEAGAPTSDAGPPPKKKKHAAFGLQKP
jgi:hypothetical protein